MFLLSSNELKWWNTTEILQVFLLFQELEVQLGAQLEVLHCDYFKLDSVSYSRHNSPYMTSEELFSRLGISERAWTEGESRRWLLSGQYRVKQELLQKLCLP